ncbi:MAG: response regulator transcription factor [Chitinophagales bacterium]
MKLTKREIEIIEKISEGLCSKEIANVLYISVRTVETHRKNIKLKLGYNNFYSVLSYAFQNNILQISSN